ncbi:unnamed protein product [Arabidopsis halleri]
MEKLQLFRGDTILIKMSREAEERSCEQKAQCHEQTLDGRE